MANHKTERINDDIRRVLAEKLREIKDPRVQQGLTSITRVDVTGDLRYCKVYVSVLGDYNEKELLKGLRSAAGWFRRELGHSLNLRYTPELIFEADDSIRQGAYISGLIAGLEINHDDDESE